LQTPSRIGYEDRLRLLEYFARKLGASRLAEAMGVSKNTFYRLLKRETPIDDTGLEIILSAIPPKEVLEILGARKRLKACVAVEGRGS